MVYTKEKFKKTWEDDMTPITYDDIADCAKAWGLYDKPKICPINEVADAVVKTAGCEYKA